MGRPLFRAPAATAALCLALAGCGDQTAVEPQVSRILVSPAKALLVGVGDGMAFSATPLGSDGEQVSAAVTWSTGDPAIATVDTRGFVTAVAAGTTGVTATAGGVSATAELEVYVRERIARYEPGVSYFGRNGYVEYIPGELPVILSAPHGGLLAPREIPDRGYGVTVNDINTIDLTLRMRQALIDLTGYAPHMILSHLRRRKLDPNREIVEAAQENPYAELAWHEFHDWIVTARSLVTSRFDEGMYFDVHGHGHDIARVELGYLLTADELNRTDAALDGLPVVRRTSIREIGRTTTIPFSQVLRGPTSFGGLLADEGVPSVPSPGAPGPGAEPYWRGGYNTRVHGSLDDGEVVSGIQLEHHYPGLRDTEENRRVYAEKVARVIREFMLEHFGFFEPGADETAAEPAIRRHTRYLPGTTFAGRAESNPAR